MAGSSYDVRATHETGFAQGTFSHRDVASGPVRLELASLWYERFDFRDEAGLPVPIRGLSALYALPPGRPVWSSVFNAESYETDGLPREISSEVLGDHEVAYLVLERTASKRGSAGARRIRIPGFEKVELPVELMSIERWPESRRVVLARLPDEAPAVAHRVVFPAFEFPEQWSGDHGKWRELTCAATTEGPASDTCWVNPDNPVFRMPRGVPFKFHVLGDRAPLSDRLHDLGDEVRVFVDWPRYAFLDLRFPAKYPGTPGALGTATVFNERRGPGGHRVAPGHARFAFLPEGEDSVRLDYVAWGGDRPVNVLSRRLGRSIRLAAGFQSHVVTDEELLAADGR